MLSKSKIPLYEHILWGIGFLILVVPLFLYIRFEPEIDQLGEAFFVTAKLTSLPYLIIFSILFWFKQIDLRNKLIKILSFTFVYTIFSIVPVLQINMNFGHQSHYIIDGVVINKKPGRGGNKAYLYVDTGTEIISFGLPKTQWANIFYEEKVAIPVNKGCLGLLYK